MQNTRLGDSYRLLPRSLFALAEGRYANNSQLYDFDFWYTEVEQPITAKLEQKLLYRTRYMADAINCLYRLKRSFSRSINDRLIVAVVQSLYCSRSIENGKSYPSGR